MLQHGPNSLEKLESLVSFPLLGLELNPYVVGPGLVPGSLTAAAAAAGQGGGGGGLVYDLYGVLNHLGGSSFGRYTVCYYITL